MAKAMTGTFTITSSVDLTAVGYTTTTIPIGSLIDVGDAQALEIESVDYQFQNHDLTNDVYEPLHPSNPLGADASFGAQVMDRNAGTWLVASDNNLISSASVNYGFGDNIVTAATDFFPDDFQKTNGRFVVNDEVYLVSTTTLAPAANTALTCSVRIRAKVVKLSTRDWMAISLETVQNE
jgi:hypothetical protein